MSVRLANVTRSGLAPVPAELWSRRRFLRVVGSAGLAGLGVGAAGACRSQSSETAPQAKTPRIGFLYMSPTMQINGMLDAFRKGLVDAGLEEGRNLAIEWRYAEGDASRLPVLAAELVALKLDLIVAPGTLATRAAMRATRTIPIVSFSNDPVGTGLVQSLARPGGNVTGVALLTAGLAAKRLELFKQALPFVSRAAVFWDSAVPDKVFDLRETEGAARALGVRLETLDIRGLDDLQRAASMIAGTGTDSIISLMDVFTNAFVPDVPRFALAQRLPIVCEGRFFVLQGGLMSYGANVGIMWGRIGAYVDRILKGAKPADLPVEQPQTFDLQVNLKTAQALGLTIPPSVLAQATEVIP